MLAEPLHRGQDPVVPEVAEAHLAEHVVDADVAQRRHLLRDAVAGAAERRVHREADRLVFRHPRVIERIEHGGVDAIVLGVVGRARVEHVAAGVEQRRRQLVLGLGLALREVDVAPHRHVAEQPLARLAADARPRSALLRTARSEPRSVPSGIRDVMMGTPSRPHSANEAGVTTLRQMGGCGRW